MPLLRRALGSLSRRLDRPELVASVYPDARQALHEELAIRAILAASLGSDSTYVDVGANRGQILAEAVRVAPEARHVAFEPIPGLAADLVRSFPGVDVRRKALGARPTTAQFCHFRTLDGWSGLRRSPEISDERGDPEFFTVEVSTLDDELAGLRPRLVKIDVEGAELEVLTGAGRLLGELRPVLILEHVASAAALYGAQPGAAWDLLADVGYRIFPVTGGAAIARADFAANATVVNWLATPSRRGGERSD
jgi:FkbM family methyltransferase